MASKREKTFGWVLNFLYEDIEKLDTAEIAKLGIDLHHNLLPDYGLLPGPASFFDVPRLRIIQDKLKSFFENYIFPLLKGQESRSPSLPCPPTPTDRFFFVPAPGRELSIGGAGGALEETVIDRVIRLLGDECPIPLDFFQACEHCGHWFFSTRTKRFCSSRCNWRFNSQKNRGLQGTEQREAYNARQREMMKDRYAEEIKRKLGSNVKIRRGEKQ